MTDGTDIVRRMLNSFADRDWDGLRASLHEKAEFRLMYPATIEFAQTAELAAPVLGADAIVAMMSSAIDPDKGTFSRLRMLNIRPHALDDGAGVVAEYESDAIVRETGRPYQNIYIGMFGTADGQITYWREYADPNRVLMALRP